MTETFCFKCKSKEYWNIFLIKNPDNIKIHQHSTFLSCSFSYLGSIHRFMNSDSDISIFFQFERRNRGKIWFWFSDVFRDYRNGILVENGLMQHSSAETHAKPYQTSNMKLFEKIVHGF